MAGRKRSVAFLIFIFPLFASLACNGSLEGEFDDFAEREPFADREHTEDYFSALPPASKSAQASLDGRTELGGISEAPVHAPAELEEAESRVLSGVSDLTAKFAERADRKEIAAALQTAADGLQETVSRLEAAREEYLADHSQVMEILQKYARARELLAVGLKSEAPTESELAERLRTATDAYNTLFVLLSAAARRAESAHALMEALSASQSAAFATLLKLAKAQLNDGEAGEGETEAATTDDVAAIRAAVYNMQDLAAAAENATRATVTARTKQSEEMASLLLRRLGHLAGAGRLMTSDRFVAGDKQSQADSEEIREQLDARVRASMRTSRSAEQTLMNDLTSEALKTVQHVAEETEIANKEAFELRASAAEPQERSKATVVLLGVMLCLAVVALLCLIVYSLAVVVSFQAKLNAARVGEQVGQAHTDD
ncbi:hypothetical protein TGME49_307820 [Toxoplasma gondii ME49]|uniref:Transmembrane protein n=1 Tax=Toxoplasma gondii (strain ATCC 50611 / Me49) TaxID=508771 RepID=S8EU99_TOXGM|nr:hypothetical protein TGME49_307820 [Toxoplasma gondii ME49]EPT24548.1 hypothetical protein TGME49_307820 [Toxoplasma gondii ME49]|eukprot:XP_002371909.1 hypothetical protein TGME49_307820 [Toxoplasma gondii ME49]